ncbi:hypothetical protein [Streptomyces violaceusniger]|uniref:Uncharacterized protein n=1 Tax=Streptomyces violaceusniger (strain Tu 4113) TaxID=653045 RepID=G2NZ31_STRV4|nr:hypothetical protein [Streptomyces violaceusniger]AEM82925.1 hypothetical protein Strvi_3237 [Streptomyces violaceusniger Tu 4113]
MADREGLPGNADRAPAGPTEAAAGAAFAVAAWLHGAAGDVVFFRGALPEDTPEVVLGHAPALDSVGHDHQRLWPAPPVAHRWPRWRTRGRRSPAVVW